jgi:hypothetical protein
MVKQKPTTRCPRCGRILFPTKDGTLPRHKVPAALGERYFHGPVASQPLTGIGDPWCEPEPIT